MKTRVIDPVKAVKHPPADDVTSKSPALVPHPSVQHGPAHGHETHDEPYAPAATTESAPIPVDATIDALTAERAQLEGQLAAVAGLPQYQAEQDAYRARIATLQAEIASRS